MRNKVTIVGKSMFKGKEDDVPDEPKPLNEQNYKETADEVDAPSE